MTLHDKRCLVPEGPLRSPIRHRHRNKKCTRLLHVVANQRPLRPKEARRISYIPGASRNKTSRVRYPSSTLHTTPDLLRAYRGEPYDLLRTINGAALQLDGATTTTTVLQQLAWFLSQSAKRYVVWKKAGRGKESNHRQVSYDTKCISNYKIKSVRSSIIQYE